MHVRISMNGNTILNRLLIHVCSTCICFVCVVYDADVKIKIPFSSSSLLILVLGILHSNILLHFSCYITCTFIFFVKVHSNNRDLFYSFHYPNYIFVLQISILIKKK